MDSVQLFMDTYPKVKEKGWNTVSAARLVAGYDGVVGQTYWNAPPGVGGGGGVKDMSILDGPKTNVGSTSTAQGTGPGSGHLTGPGMSGPGKAVKQASDSGARMNRRSTATASSTASVCYLLFWAWQRWF